MFNSKFSHACLPLLAAGLFGFSSGVSAAPILGAQLYYGGGSVEVEVQPATAGYTSELGLYNTSFTRLGSYIALNTQVGAVIDISSLISSSGLVAGDELIFGIYVQNTGDTFFMGSATRNTDGLLHAGVDVLSSSPIYTANVGFEDLLNGGDRDYDDNVFQFRGSISTNRVPEPGTLLLASLGLLGLGLMRRNNKSADLLG